MKLVVGLGNPGDKYGNTRHNAGFLVVDALIKRYGPIDSNSSHLIENNRHDIADFKSVSTMSSSVVLVKSQEFMNNSGATVRGLKKKHPELENKDIYVVHDDLDIKLGEYKISEKGPKAHNGLKSIYEQVGKDFVHVRIGIDARHSPGKVSKENQRLSGEDYVLSNWKPEEREVLEKVIKRVVEELKNVLT